MMSTKQYVAWQIRTLRTTHHTTHGTGLKMTQEDLATALGMNQPTTVSHWENGHHFPTPEYLEKLAEVFRVTVASLFPPYVPGQQSSVPPLTADEIEAHRHEVSKSEQYKPMDERLLATIDHLKSQLNTEERDGDHGAQQ